MEVLAGSVSLNFVTITYVIVCHELTSMLFSGEDAYKKIRAGAILVQLYTAFAYGGPALIPKIKVRRLLLFFSNVSGILK